MINLTSWFKPKKYSQVSPRLPVRPTSTLDIPTEVETSPQTAAPVTPSSRVSPVPQVRPVISSGFKRGDKVMITTMSRPDLLGADATVLRVLPGGQRVYIQVDKTKEEFLAKPSILLNLTNPNAAKPSTTSIPIPPRSRNKVYLRESSNQTVNNALLYKRNVAFEYVDLHGNYTTRDVEPHIVFQATGTLNELLLTKDWVLRNGDWRCFRVEAMSNVSMGDKYSFKLDDTYTDVKDSIKNNIIHKAEKYHDPTELFRHIDRDNTLTGLMAYRHKLKHDILRRALKHHNIYA